MKRAMRAKDMLTLVYGNAISDKRREEVASIGEEGALGSLTEQEVKACAT